MTARPPTVADLVGQRLATIGRAADMAWLGFGEKRVDDRGRVVHAYALHLQTAFRLLEGDHVLLGSSDLFAAPDHPSETAPDFTGYQEAARAGATPTYFDRCVLLLLQRLEFVPISVTDATVGIGGALRIAMAPFTLEVFPTRSFVAEHWRLLRPGTPAPHLVMFDADD